MAGEERRRPDWGPPGKMVTDGMRAAVDEVIDRAATPMLREAPRATRLILKKIPGAPGLALDAVEFGQAKDRLRKLAGIGGSTLGGLAGGALGVATGPAAPVAAPIGAAVGSVAGEHIAEEIYDDHAALIQRGLARTNAWMKRREAQIARRAAALASSAARFAR